MMKVVRPFVLAALFDVINVVSALDVPVLYESPRMLIVNKPSGISVRALSYVG